MNPSSLQRALTADGAAPVVQFNQVLSEAVANEDGVPEFIQLTPGGNRFTGRDGRSFRIRSPRQMVRDFNNSGEDLQIDIDHESEMPFGGSASVGWITSMELRNSREIWAAVEWTPQGAELVGSRTFRGISPTFTVDRDSLIAFLEDESKPMEVTGFTSVALTNRPNLPLRSLNTEQGTHPTEEKQTMDIGKLFAALGLGEDATEADALNAIKSLGETPNVEPNAAAPALPDLDKYVPRADYEQKLTQLNTVQAQLKEQADKQREAEVELLINSAVKAGKIAPASEEFYRQVCDTDAGLAKTKAHLASAAVIVQPNTLVTKAEDVGDQSGKGLTPAQEHLARMWGFTAEQFHAEHAKLVEEGKLQA